MTYTSPGNNPNFDNDFAKGKVGENLVDTFLYALEGGSIEVKTDFGTQKTGNFYVEFEQWNRSGERKPSGIETTKSSHWVMASPNGVGGVIVTTEWLRELLEWNVFPEGEQSVVNGSTNGSRGHLIPASVLYRKLKLGV